MRQHPKTPGLVTPVITCGSGAVSTTTSTAGETTLPNGIYEILDSSLSPQPQLSPSSQFPLSHQETSPPITATRRSLDYSRMLLMTPRRSTHTKLTTATAETTLASNQKTSRALTEPTSTQPVPFASAMRSLHRTNLAIESLFSPDAYLDFNVVHSLASSAAPSLLPQSIADYTSYESSRFLNIDQPSRRLTATPSITIAPSRTPNLDPEQSSYVPESLPNLMQPGSAQFTLIVSVPPSTTRQDLLNAFKIFGRVVMPTVVCKKETRHPKKEWTATAGYAFVLFGSKKAARNALAATEAGLVVIHGVSVKATWAKKDSFKTKITASEFVHETNLLPCIDDLNPAPVAQEPAMLQLTATQDSMINHLRGVQHLQPKQLNFRPPAAETYTPPSYLLSQALDAGIIVSQISGKHVGVNKPSSHDTECHSINSKSPVMPRTPQDTITTSFTHSNPTLLRQFDQSSLCSPQVDFSTRIASPLHPGSSQFPFVPSSSSSQTPSSPDPPLMRNPCMSSAATLPPTATENIATKEIWSNFFNAGAFSSPSLRPVMPNDSNDDRRLSGSAAFLVSPSLENIFSSSSASLCPNENSISSISLSVDPSRLP